MPCSNCEPKTRSLACEECPSNATSRRPSRHPSPQEAKADRPRGRLGPRQDLEQGPQGPLLAPGFKLSPIFEGGQMPLARRVPKRGFVNGAFKKSYAIVNLDDAGASSRPARSSTKRRFATTGWSKATRSTASRSWVTATLTKPLEVHATKFSGSAAAKIAAAEGRPSWFRTIPTPSHARPKETGRLAGRELRSLRSPCRRVLFV